MTVNNDWQVPVGAAARAAAQTPGPTPRITGAPPAVEAPDWRGDSVIRQALNEAARRAAEAVEANLLAVGAPGDFELGTGWDDGNPWVRIRHIPSGEQVTVCSPDGVPVLLLEVEAAARLRQLLSPPTT